MMIRAALLAACLSTPALAQDWTGVVRVAGDLRSADPALAYRSAAAACIAGRGNAEMTALIFESAGWAFSPDEAGLNAFQSTHPEVYVLLSAEGDFCAAFSERQGTDTATVNLMMIAVAGALSLDSAPSDLGCQAYALAPGIVAEVNSSGNDPVCDDSRNSSIRITFGPAG